jgi:hypothetical protein
MFDSSFSGVDEKVIHLVKRPPPSVTASGNAGGQGTTGGQGATEGVPEGSVTVQASQDVVFVGNIPMSSHTNITQVTQVMDTGVCMLAMLIASHSIYLDILLTHLLAIGCRTT